MGDIYQEIWNADQAENGVEPLLDSEAGKLAAGFAKVNGNLETGGPDLKVITDVKIPDGKTQTYDLCRMLFDNYALAEPMPEIETPEERQEVHDLVDAMIDTAPMKVARDYVARETGTTVSRDRWYTTVVEMWFRRFSAGGDPDLSGFEHIVVGEQQGAKVQGYHFWYKYWLDDGLARQVDQAAQHFPGLKDDRITYAGSRMKGSQHQFPETVTISYRWNAPDYDAGAIRPLSKRIGGFFVGCSVEGLLALGTVRAHRGIRAPKVAVIEGARYDMKLFHAPSGNQVRTFYPVFLGASDLVDGAGRPGGTNGTSGGAAGGGVIDPGHDGGIVDPGPGPVRIVAAKVNPSGNDVGLETVTLINTSAAPVVLTNWQIEDRNGNRDTIGAMTLAPGGFETIRLTGEGAQLSNKGGTIALVGLDGAGVETLAHKVSYSKAQAQRQGATVLF